MIATVTLNASVDKLYLVESLNPYEVSRVKKVNNTAGGKGMNVSRIISQAGEDVAAAGIIGGYNGMLFESLITQINIAKCFTRIEGETRCCVNLWDLSAQKSTEYLEPGFTVTSEDLERFVEDYIRVVKICGAVCISGSTPPGTPDDFCARLVSIAGELGKPVLVDVAGVQLKEAIKARPTVIKPNKDEIEQLFPIDSSSFGQLAQTAQSLRQSGIEIAAISVGKEGAVVACGQGVFYAKPPAVDVVNTVGSGDSMIAGFAIGICRKYSVIETIRYAVALATANTLTMETGSFKKQDLESLLPKIQIEKMD
jgi:tagatose 6-phosphate kinase